MTHEQIHTTLTYLRLCQTARAQGSPVSVTRDPAWLVEQAINRRGGWPDDPSHTRGSCLPVQGRYPKKAEGTTYTHLRNLSRKVNTPRLIVPRGELGEWRTLITHRVPQRIE